MSGVTGGGGGGGGQSGAPTGSLAQRLADAANISGAHVEVEQLPSALLAALGGVFKTPDQVRAAELRKRWNEVVVLGLQGFEAHGGKGKTKLPEDLKLVPQSTVFSPTHDFHYHKIEKEDFRKDFSYSYSLLYYLEAVDEAMMKDPKNLDLHHAMLSFAARTVQRDLSAKHMKIDKQSELLAKIEKKLDYDNLTLRMTSSKWDPDFADAYRSAKGLDKSDFKKPPADDGGH